MRRDALHDGWARAQLPRVRGALGAGMASRLAVAAQELLWPTRCVGCGLPGALVCDACLRSLSRIDQEGACPDCGAPFGRLVCTQCRHDWGLAGCVCACSFEGTAARMVTSLKDAHELRLAPLLAAAMAGALEEAASVSSRPAAPAPSASPASRGPCRGRADSVPQPLEGTGPEEPRLVLPADLDALCFVPATTDAYVRRGFDHMELVARPLASALGVPLADVLVRQSAQDQRLLGRSERAANLAGSVVVCDDVRGLRMLVADDVVTSGASVREAARALLARGAASVTALAFARVW